MRSNTAAIASSSRVSIYATMAIVSPDMSDYFRELGRKGGKIDGKIAAAAASMTPGQRKERARKAVGIARVLTQFEFFARDGYPQSEKSGYSGSAQVL